MAARAARRASRGPGFSYLSVKGAENRLGDVVKRQRQVHPKLRVPKQEWLFKPGDHVAVVRGELKGQKGIVKACFVEQNEVIVRGVNHYRPDPISMREKHNLSKYQLRNRIERGIYSVEGPMDYHSLRLVDFESGIIEVSPPDAYAEDSSLLREHLRRVLRVCKCRTLDLEILESDEDEALGEDADADEDAAASLRYIVTIEPPKPAADCEFIPTPLSLASLQAGERLDVPSLRASIGRVLKSVQASSFEDSDYADELEDGDEDDGEAADVDLDDDDDVKTLDSKDNVEDAEIEDIPSSSSSAGGASSSSASSAPPAQDAKDMTVDAEGVPEELPEGAITLKSLFVLGSGSFTGKDTGVWGHMTVGAEGVPEELPEGAITLKSLFVLGSGDGCPAMWVQVPKRKFKDGQAVVVASGPDKGRVGIVQEHYLHQVLIQFDDELGAVINEEQAKSEATNTPPKAWSRKEVREIQAEIDEKGDNITENDESVRKLPLLHRARVIAQLRAFAKENASSNSLPDPSASTSSSLTHSEADSDVSTDDLSESSSSSSSSSSGAPLADAATEKVLVWTEIHPLRFDTGEPEQFDYKSTKRRRVGRRLLSQCSPDFPFPYVELPGARKRAVQQRALHGPEEEIFPQPTRARNEILDTAYEAAFRRTVDPRTFGMAVA